VGDKKEDGHRGVRGAAREARDGGGVAKGVEAGHGHDDDDDDDDDDYGEGDEELEADLKVGQRCVWGWASFAAWIDGVERLCSDLDMRIAVRARHIVT